MGPARGGQFLCTVADVVFAVHDGYTTTKALVEHLCDAYQTSKRTAERLFSKTLKVEGIKQFTRARCILGRKAEKLFLLRCFSVRSLTRHP